jgi:hypothetical protein
MMSLQQYLDQYSLVLHTVEMSAGHLPLYTRDLAKHIFRYTWWVLDNPGRPQYSVEELLEACRVGNLEPIKYSINSFAIQVNVYDNCLVRYACTFGQTEVAIWLIEHGADVESAVYAARRDGHDSLATRLEQ